MDDIVVTIKVEVEGGKYKGKASKQYVLDGNEVAENPFAGLIAEYIAQGVDIEEILREGLQNYLKK